MAKATVAISQDFFNSFAALPKSKQNKVMEFLSKFRSNPEANGFNYEKIQNASDPNMRSVRIDDTLKCTHENGQMSGCKIPTCGQ